MCFEVEKFLIIFVMPMSLRDCENFLEDFENKSVGRADKCLSSYPEVSWHSITYGAF